MKTLILIFGCLMLLAISSSVFAEASTDRQAAENSNQQLAQPQVEEIENYYAGQIIELKQRAEAEIELLKVADKAVYACLAAQAEATQTVLNIDDYGYQTPRYLEAKTERMRQLKKERRYGYVADSIEISPERFAAAQSLIAERKSEILAKLEYGTADLERQKNYALSVTLPELEKRLRENQLKPEPKSTHGLVTGIVYSADRPCAAIDRKIVHEGDVIDGVTVVKINRDSVKFSRKSKSWEQKVQQAQDTNW
ncbi:MAG: hypothetical protein WC454_09345 [Phycisphaerae bacterium]|jgi:hypothetical protein